MVGLVLSTFVTLKVQVAELLLASVAVSVITVVPIPETALPIAGDCVMVGVPQLSAPVAKLV